MRPDAKKLCPGWLPALEAHLNYMAYCWHRYLCSASAAMFVWEHTLYSSFNCWLPQSLMACEFRFLFNQCTGDLGIDAGFCCINRGSFVAGFASSAVSGCPVRLSCLRASRTFCSVAMACAQIAGKPWDDESSQSVKPERACRNNHIRLHNTASYATKRGRSVAVMFSCEAQACLP